MPKIQKYWVIIQNNQCLLVNNYPFLDDWCIKPLLSFVLREFFLGLIGEVEYYCAEINQQAALSHPFELVALRQALSIMHPNEYAIGVKAYSIIQWDKNHQFCGRCGNPTHHLSLQFERICSQCQMSFFPRISPSIIVLIHQHDKILMARSPHFAPGIYGLIAGFVEVGETIEEAVHREVKEEVNLTIKNLVYAGSQPWPFPDSLMLAFTAEYESGELIIDHNEIEDAGWYRYDALPNRPTGSISISSSLLTSFILKQQCTDRHHPSYLGE